MKSCKKLGVLVALFGAYLLIGYVAINVIAPSCDTRHANLDEM